MMDFHARKSAMMSAVEITQERRRSVRSRSFIGGQLIFNQRRSTLDCTVRNLSDMGALILLSDAVTVPDVVELYLPQKRESRMARICWRDRERAGIEFVTQEAKDEPFVPLDLVRRIKQLERENAQLKARIAQLTDGA